MTYRVQKRKGVIAKVAMKNYVEDLQVAEKEWYKSKGVVVKKNQTKKKIYKSQNGTIGREGGEEEVEEAN